MGVVDKYLLLTEWLIAGLMSIMTATAAVVVVFFLLSLVVGLIQEE